MTVITDDFDHVRSALSQCEAYLLSTRRADDLFVIVGEHDQLLRAVRLALSVCAGPVTTEELEPFIGNKWVVVQRRSKTRADDRYQILSRELREVERRAIEARISLSQ
jgi:hypothetical protein